MSKQIEEMAKDIYESKSCDTSFEENCKLLAYDLVTLGYQKVEEDSVVFSKEEYESLKNEPVSIFKNYQEMVKFYGEEVRNLKAKNEELKNQLVKKCKETAEKILDFLRKDNGVNAWAIIRFEKFIKEQFGVELKE